MGEIRSVASRNRILGALPLDEFRRIEDDLRLCDMSHGATYFTADEPIIDVYFPLSGACSLIAITPEGQSTDVAVVGNEGFGGLPVFLGTDQVPFKAIGQVPGEALRMDADDFRREVANDGKLVKMLRRYTQMSIVEMAQTILCNRVHPLEARTARWLLQLDERVEEAPFELTQEFFATMLGVHRPSVTQAAMSLREAGLIDYSRGVIDVVDREGLERASCDCYRVIRNELDRLVETGPS
jgi:CRP-like cAMP-binding protein